ncbi:helix-turn-helix domain-containing protein [Rhodobacteraceae bacterium NNCM2]|nr:helix-turn-helix domain-containing protein [Coraliihabitans acroporae]
MYERFEGRDPVKQEMENVGSALRERRLAKGLSRRQLAEMAGVTHATVSNIENDRTSPSLATLARILDVFGLTFAEFFNLQKPPVEQVFYTKDEMMLLSEGDFEIRQVGPGRGSDTDLQILRTRYRPGAGTGEEMLQHDAEEGGIVIAGEIELTVAGRTRILGEGDGYLFRSSQPHQFRNIGEVDCIIIAACTPPYL